MDQIEKLIDEIEQHKDMVRKEHDDLREKYIAGVRISGLTKRETENRLHRLTGEILGHEYALTFLYRALPLRKLDSDA